MTEMLEKMCRAHLEADGLHEHAPSLSWAGLLPSERAGCISAMRAALLAIRDLPANDAEVAAANVFGPTPLPHEVSNFDSGWVSAIDAILGEAT